MQKILSVIFIKIKQIFLISYNKIKNAYKEYVIRNVYKENHLHLSMRTIYQKIIAVPF